MRAARVRAGVLSLALACVGAVWADGPDPTVLAEGKAIFTEKAAPTCATCHALADAEAVGTLGPDLDHLQPDHDQMLAVLRDGAGVMPSFEEQLDAEQMEAVIAYVLSATRGE